jgi:uncharacterized protein YbjT (DUF2867 family)
MQQKMKTKKIIVLGSTGYVGGRLVARLLDEGYQVRATGRSKDKLKSRFWADHPNVEHYSVDIHDPDSLRKALKGMDVAYYLVHSMNPQSADFETSDRMAANNMVRLAKECDLQRIIYLSGLGEKGGQLSQHLKSRQEVAEILKSGPVPVTVFRAAMIIGSGSASFEILRYLVERLPVMITPRWVKTPNQPIAIRNVIEYLCRCIEEDETIGETFDIGGKEVVSYLELMRIYAEEAGLRKRWIIPIPVLTPHLSSLWIHLVTPVPSYIARPLAEGLRNPVVCQDHRIRDIIPQDILDCREAIKLAIMRIHTNDVQTSWVDAGTVPDDALVQEGDPHWAGGTILEDKRQRMIRASKEKVWNVVSRIGGERGWYHGTWLWVLRGFIDRLVGGVGLGRGRRNSEKILAGDALDFWRVISVQENDHLSLVAEMKLPGFASLDFRIKQIDKDTCELIQHARFQPKGLTGILYWYALIPIHEYIFGGMIRKISKLSEREHID